MKRNILDENGFYIEDHVEGPLPKFWTIDLVGDGYYKAQYQNASINKETGEWTSGAWVEMGDVPPPDYLTPALAEQTRLMEIATIKISPLQDAVDLNVARDSEIELLNKWKIYRIKLNRLDLSMAPNVEWPEMPE